MLSELVKHHVREEKQPEGIFAEARGSYFDLEALDEHMAARKAELQNGVGNEAATEDEDEGDRPAGADKHSGDRQPGRADR